MIGALLLSRVVDDPEMSAEILAASARELTQAAASRDRDAEPKREIN
jgi:hypothetical protein